MPLDYSNPHTLRFLIENFEKENEKRIIWFNKNKQEIITAASYGPNFKDYRTEDVSRALVELSLPALSCQHAKSFINRKRKPEKDAPIVSRITTKISAKLRDIPKQMIADLRSDNIMKPIEEDIVKIFYKGLPSGGRLQYLKARKRKSPDEKYYLDQTNNHAIGWQLKEGTNMNQPLQYGRHWTLTHELRNRTGNQPDPCYYQRPQMDPYVKCFNS